MIKGHIALMNTLARANVYDCIIDYAHHLARCNVPNAYWHTPLNALLHLMPVRIFSSMQSFTNVLCVCMLCQNPSCAHPRRSHGGLWHDALPLIFRGTRESSIPFTNTKRSATSSLTSSLTSSFISDLMTWFNKDSSSWNSCCICDDMYAYDLYMLYTVWASLICEMEVKLIIIIIIIIIIITGVI